MASIFVEQFIAAFNCSEYRWCIDVC